MSSLLIGLPYSIFYEDRKVTDILHISIFAKLCCVVPIYYFVPVATRYVTLSRSNALNDTTIMIYFQHYATFCHVVNMLEEALPMRKVRPRK